MLVLAPTRELAVQIEDEIHGLAYHTDLTSAAVYGGVEMGTQERALKAGVDIIVATPGRLMDHMRQQNADLERRRPARARRSGPHDGHGLLARRPPHHHDAAAQRARQTLLFSATMPDDVVRLALEIVRDAEVRAGRPAQRAGRRSITHRVETVAAAAEDSTG